ncbi:uncharacterized protein [Diabrotica undecimpunctata]|uniref:uncharacterized protein n=1 Tax=Diabrotica undecimpunctata TaxID=50387 RepID=UPI003B6330DD
MFKNNYLFIRCIIFLWATVCVVVAEHQKRDVHRIILQERVPRSHKGHSHQNHSRGKRKGQGHHKKGKRNSDESYSLSVEDNQSFEDIFKSHKNHHQHHKDSLFNNPQFGSNLDLQESRHHPFKELQPFYGSDWIPVNFDNHHSNAHSHESHHREKDRRTKRRPKKPNYKNSHNHYGSYANSPSKVLGKPFIELGNSENLGPIHHAGPSSNLPPTFPSSVESSTLYPPIDVLSTFSALNKQLLETNPPMLAENEDSEPKEDPDRLKNHKSSYDVQESEASDLGTIIYMPDSTPAEFSPSEFPQRAKFEARPNMRHRGSKKFNSKFS